MTSEELELVCEMSAEENCKLLSRSSSGDEIPEHEESSDNEDERKSQARELESYLNRSGFGLFHVILLIVVGLATAADAVEIFGVAFVLPIAENDLDLTTADKGWLDASIFIGMLLGGYVWGSFADAIGRRMTLVTAMLWNGVCGLVSAFSPNFGLFLFFRFVSGIGVGGSQPVVFSYLSEFFTEKQRGPMIILLAACWQPGIIFTALLAWGLMGIEGPHSEISFYIGSLHFVNWRLFLIICTLPAFLSTISLLFLPESPAYLLNVGKIPSLVKVINKIHRVNKACPYCHSKEDTTPLLNDTEDQQEDTSSKSESPEPRGTEEQSVPRSKACLYYIMNKLRKIGLATIGIFRWKYLRATVLLLIIWFTQSFGYYGVQLWFPEFFKRLRTECIEDFTLDALNCTSNETNETNLQFYQDTLYTALASLPGNIAGTLLINILGGRVQLAIAMILSTGSLFTIWSVPNNHAAVVGVSCLFSAVTVTVFGALDVVNMNTYDVDVRSTAFGVHSGIGRVGAILGNVMFGHLLDVDRGIPILIVASLLTTGAICAVFLPPIYRPENRPPLERLLYKLWKKCRPIKRKETIALKKNNDTCEARYSTTLTREEKM